MQQQQQPLTSTQRELIEAHAHLPRSTALRLAGNGDVEEAEGFAIDGLVKAAQTFDPARGASFKTFAILLMRQAIFDEFGKRGRRQALSLDAAIYSDDEQTTLAQVVSSDRELRPEEAADLNERKKRLLDRLKTNHSITLRECRQRTPAPAKLGQYYEAMRQVVCDSVSEKDVAEIMKSLVARAKDGDVNAAKLVLAQVAGPAAPRVTQTVEVKQVTLADLEDTD